MTTLTDLKGYVGRSRTSTDVVTASAVGRMAVAIDADIPALPDGGPIPHGWHGVFFPPVHRLSELRADGQFGGGLAPVPLPRRRLMGSRSAYHDALRIGDRISQTLEIADVVVRDRGAGPTVLVIQRESISSSRGLAVVEERDVLYFGMEGPGTLDAPPDSPASPAWRRTYESDPVMIWRLCAVRYKMCRVEEPKRPLASFSYISIGPICDTGPFTILGSPGAGGHGVRMWALDGDGKLGLTAEATFAG